MAKLLEVREFEKISCNSEYEEYKYLPEPVFKDLVNFIHAFAGDENHADALEFMTIGYRRNVGEIVSMSNYVGLIQMNNGYQIQVLPKIEFTDSKETKKIFLRMLRSMKDFPSKVFNHANLRTEEMSLYEVFISMYLQEVDRLVKRGIKSSYITVEDNLRFYKGKLLVNQHIKNNISHQERFYVEYDDYNVNRAENRLIKSTLLKLNAITESTHNNKQIRQLLAAFELVNPSSNYEKDFQNVTIDRNSKDYETLMQWSKVFLMNKSFTTFSGDNNARALLFPMESLFESYVAQQLKRVYAHEDWDISLQDRHFYLFDEPRHQFALRPDIVMTDNAGHTVILDTKWKKLVDNSRFNYGISQADMYQMYAYSKKYNTEHIVLLYPINAEMESHDEIIFSSDDGVTVRIFFVDLSDIDKSMAALKKQIEETVYA